MAMDASNESYSIPCVKDGCRCAVPVVKVNCDQTVVCRMCGTSFVFYGLVTTECPHCRMSTETCTIGNTRTFICDKCGKTSPVDRDHSGALLCKIARPLEELEGSYYYCGLDYFADFEEQAQIARTAFDKIEKPFLGLFRRASKRMVFFNLLERELKLGPKLRILHGMCNFSFLPTHKPAKFITLIFPPSLLKLFGVLVDKNGVTDFWLSSEETRRTLAQIPELRNFEKRFRIHHS